MKKLLGFLFLILLAPVAWAQTASTYYTVPTIAALKALTTRPSVIQTTDANPGIFNWSTAPCSAADDIFQVTPTAGPTGCYTRASTPYTVGKSATTNGVLVTNGTGVPSISTTLPNGLAMGTPASLNLANATGLPNAGLLNSSVTVNGSTVALGGSTTITAASSSITSSTTAATGFANGHVVGVSGGTTTDFPVTGTGNVALVSQIATGGTSLATLAERFGLSLNLKTDFSAACDGVTDDTTHINAWLAAVHSTGKMGTLPTGTCVFTSALTSVPFGNLTIYGQGIGSSILMYAGASATPGDLMVLGASTMRRITLAGFAIDSSTRLTAGSALRINSSQDISIDINIGNESTYNLFNGLLLDSDTVVNLNSTRALTYNDNIVISNGTEIHLNHAFVRGKVISGVLGNTHTNTTLDGLTTNATTEMYTGMSVYGSGIPRGTTISAIVNATTVTLSQAATATATGVSFTIAGTGNGVHVGGGSGGVYFENTTQLYNNIGFRIDTSITGTGNLQIFGGGSTTDSNNQWGWYVNDAISNSVGKVINWGDAWAASSNGGGGLAVVAWASGNVGISGGVFTNNVGPGATFDDATSKVSIGAGAQFTNNGTYGITAANPITIESVASPYNNTTAPINTSTVTAVATLKNVSAVNVSTVGGSINMSLPRAAGGPLNFMDTTVTTGDTVQMGWGAGNGAQTFNIYKSTANTGAVVQMAQWTTAGAVTFPSTITATLGSDATHTDNTVCVDSSSGLFYKGSGTLGVCLGTSSARFKTNIVSDSLGLSKIEALKPVAFNYKKGYGDDGAHRQHGFLAEDVVKVLPDLVGLDKEGKPNSVDLLGMIPTLVNAVKELKANNDNLALEVTKLKKVAH